MVGPGLYFIGGAGWAGGRIFDYGSDEVRNFLIHNAMMLLDEFHVDGFRYDEVSVIHNNDGSRFCRDLTSSLRYAKPGAIQIAEYWNWDRAKAVEPAPDGLGFDAACTTACVARFAPRSARPQAGTPLTSISTPSATRSAALRAFRPPGRRSTTSRTTIWSTATARTRARPSRAYRPWRTGPTAATGLRAAVRAWRPPCC